MDVYAGYTYGTVALALVRARGQRRLKKATHRICHSVHTPRHRHPPRLGGDSKSLSSAATRGHIHSRGSLAADTVDRNGRSVGRSLPRFPLTSPFLLFLLLTWPALGLVTASAMWMQVALFLLFFLPWIPWMTSRKATGKCTSALRVLVSI